MPYMVISTITISYALLTKWYSALKTLSPNSRQDKIGRK